MRFYRIIITNPTTNKVIYQISTQNADGSNNLSAQQIEIDLPISTVEATYGAAFLKIWGISLQDIGGAFNLNGMNIQIFGGMSKGLPLANPNQSGLLVQGTIFQAYGNWQGTDQNLNFQILPQYGTQSNPKNFSFNWIKGQPLSEAIQSTLSVALPDFKLNINISNNLVLSNTQPGFYQSLPQFATYIKQISQGIMIGNSTYQGIKMIIGNGAINIFDGTSQTSPKEIIFSDIIGQPVWLNLSQIQLRVVMRADLSVSDFISLPPIIGQTTPNSFANVKNQTVFQGIFQIQSIRHVGNSRALSGSDWVTIIDCNNTVAVI